MNVEDRKTRSSVDEYIMKQRRAMAICSALHLGTPLQPAK
jgi:hypothetical protein